MNSAVFAKRNNRRFFFVSVALAMVLAGASGFFVKEVLSGKANGVDLSTRSCLSMLRTNGFNPTVSENKISVQLATLLNMEQLVYKSGVIIASCPAYTLKDYCAGSGCSKPGVSFTLQKKP